MVWHLIMEIVKGYQIKNYKCNGDMFWNFGKIMRTM